MINVVCSLRECWSRREKISHQPCVCCSLTVSLTAQIMSGPISPLHHQLTRSCHPSSRPMPAAPLPMLPGAPAVAGQVDALAGTVWAVRRPSNGRSINLGSGDHSCLGRGAPAQMGKVGKKEWVDYWKMMVHLWPGQTPCPNLKEVPGTVEWNRWRHGARWICPQMLFCRYLLSYTMQW